MPVVNDAVFSAYRSNQHTRIIVGRRFYSHAWRTATAIFLCVSTTRYLPRDHLNKKVRRVGWCLHAEGLLDALLRSTSYEQLDSLSSRHAKTPDFMYNVVSADDRTGRSS